MLGQRESEGYADVIDAVVTGGGGREVKPPSFPLFDSTAAESVSNHNEAELQRRCQERQQEIDHMQQVLETKIQLLQEVCPIRTSKRRRGGVTTDTV